MLRITIKNELIPLFPQDKLALSLGDFTVVAGCNGAGKSTLLRAIKHATEKKPKSWGETVYLDCNQIFNERNADNIPSLYRTLTVVTQVMRSEHEHYEDMFLDFVSALRPPDEFRGKHFVVLIDGLDSGEDVYNAQQHIDFFKMMVEDAKSRGINITLVISCNSFYYLTHASFGKVLFVPSLTAYKLPKYKTKQYDKYVEDILLTREQRFSIKEEEKE